ncbi:Os11g0626700 [Oryza sativa Japonica Group]|uniref:Os11g0626700 protein n=1 Tax=Oryza sativa subsp. japonica TaxID=39947 RepID=Q0IRJ2_ORYSJ|nr:Os11g0626700 [Oryza sativa Japonica Group]|eukprot:NP_001068310.1 Os11g0626700 [Oryza sativa Japonica Group]
MQLFQQFSCRASNLCSSKMLVAESLRESWLCTVFSITRNAVLGNVRIARIERQKNHPVVVMGISPCYCIAFFSASPEAKLKSRATYVGQSCCLPIQILLWFSLLFGWILMSTHHSCIAHPPGL